MKIVQAINLKWQTRVKVLPQTIRGFQQFYADGKGRLGYKVHLVKKEAT